MGAREGGREGGEVHSQEAEWTPPTKAINTPRKAAILSFFLFLLPFGLTLLAPWSTAWLEAARAVG